MGTNQFLILKVPQFQTRFHELLATARDDEGFRRLYLNDPIGVIRNTVFPEVNDVPAAEINRGNRLLYALLSNSEFIEWSQSFERDLIDQAKHATKIEDPLEALRVYGTVVDRTKIHQETADAIARFADAETIAALTWRSEPNLALNPRPPADIAVDVETFVYAVAAIAVFVVAVAAVAVAESLAGQDEVLSRLDILAVARQLTVELDARAAEVRESGVLMDFSRRNMGFTR